MGAPTKPTSEIFPPGQARGSFLTHHHTCRLNLVYGPERGKRHVKMKSEWHRGVSGALQKRKKNTPVEMELELSDLNLDVFVFQLESICCCSCCRHLAGYTVAA